MPAQPKSKIAGMKPVVMRDRHPNLGVVKQEKQGGRGVGGWWGWVGVGGWGWGLGGGGVGWGGGVGRENPIALLYVGWLVLLSPAPDYQVEVLFYKLTDSVSHPEIYLVEDYSIIPPWRHFVPAFPLQRPCPKNLLTATASLSNVLANPKP